jgi:signal peptidase I
MVSVGVEPKKKSKRRVGVNVAMTLTILFAFAVFAYFDFRTVVVSGESMLPTFKNGDHVLVCSAYWLVGPVKPKDIVVIESPEDGGYIIKRVYKVGGEVVDWYNIPRSWSLKQGEFKVPDGMIYLLGDNREVSEDSRVFGPVEESRVLGKVVLRP